MDKTASSYWNIFPIQTGILNVKVKWSYSWCYSKMRMPTMIWQDFYIESKELQ